MEKLINFTERCLENLNIDIEFYFNEIEDLLLDEIFDEIREEVCSGENSFFLETLGNYIMKKKKENITYEDDEILEEMINTIHDLLEIFEEKIRLMALNEMIILWRDSENPNLVRLIFHKGKLDTYDYLIINSQEYLLACGRLEKIPFKHVLESSKYGTLENVTRFLFEINNLDISTKGIVRKLRNNYLKNNC